MKNALFIILFITSSVFSQVVKTEREKIEFIGLKKWNAQTLIDSIKLLNPGKPIHACAGQMKDELGFSGVSVVSYSENNNNTPSLYTIVTVVEDDKDKIHYLTKPPDSLSLLDQYKECADIMKKNSMIYYAGAQIYNLYKKGAIDSAENQLKYFRMELKDVQPFWNYLSSKNSVADMNLAIWVLNNDANLLNRQIAFAILSNFNNYDATWWTILQQQRFKKTPLRRPAMLALTSLCKNPRKVDWTPAVESIKSILQGTNLFALNKTLEALTKTKISPDLADAVLTDSGNLIYAYLNAEHAITKKRAVDFIKQISGDKSLENAEDCKLWLSRYLN